MKLMKVGILTLNSAHNFGASLQAYALQKTLEKLNFDVKIINYRYKKIDYLYNPYRRAKKGKLDIKFYLSRIKLHTIDRYKIKKYNKYEEFMKKYFNLTKPYKTDKELFNEKWDYDFYVCGSDQIWNPQITKGIKREFFLKFIPETSKKIAYAASLGTDNIDPLDIPIFNLYINSLDHISVREKSFIPSIKKCTTKNIENTLDPTLLLDKKDYDIIKNNANLKDKFKIKDYIFVYIIDYNEELCKIAEKISKEKNIPIILSSPYLKPKKLFKNQINGFWDAGPEEFLEVISNAKYVVTNSFHGNIFSIIYKKKFISSPHKVTSARVLELMNSLNIEHLIYTNSEEFDSIDDIQIDYDDVEKRLEKLKNKSIDFLKNSLNDKKKKHQENFLENNKNKFRCYGCFLCKELCPVNAIEMIDDFEGFSYPKIDEKICNNCKICENSCIYSKKELIENHPQNKENNYIYSKKELTENHTQNKENNYIYSKKELTENCPPVKENNEFPTVYAAYNKDTENRNNSSSGGIFLPLSQKILSEDGFVVGVKYNSNMEAKYHITNEKNDIKKFSGSKYVRSDIENIFPTIEKLLNEGKKVLFTGVPCHVAGLKKYINEKCESKENLFLVEILCHSNPSPKVFKKYNSYLEKKFNSKIIDFKFKNKSNGWNHPSVEIIFENGKKIIESGKYNNYNRGFQIGLIARPSCHNCEFTKENRVGDITIGDFWGIEKFKADWNDDKGVSLIILNNEKGKKLFNEIKNKLNFSQKTMKEAFEKNHSLPIPMKRNRTEFFNKFDIEEIDSLLYNFNIPKQRLKEKRK